MYHEGIHLVHHQGGPVVQRPAVDGTRIRGVLHLVPKHAIVQIVQTHEVVRVVDVYANIESPNKQILSNGPANLDVEEVVSISHRRTNHLGSGRVDLDCVGVNVRRGSGRYYLIRVVEK